MQHDGGTTALAPAETIATWPKGSFAENLAIDDDGTIYVTLHTDRAVVRVDPATRTVPPFARYATPVAGRGWCSGRTARCSSAVGIRARPAAWSGRPPAFDGTPCATGGKVHGGLAYVSVTTRDLLVRVDRGGAGPAAP